MRDTSVVMQPYELGFNILDVTENAGCTFVTGELDVFQLTAHETCEAVPFKAFLQSRQNPFPENMNHVGRARYMKEALELCIQNTLYALEYKASACEEHLERLRAETRRTDNRWVNYCLIGMPTVHPASTSHSYTVIRLAAKQDTIHIRFTSTTVSIDDCISQQLEGRNEVDAATTLLMLLRERCSSMALKLRELFPNLFKVVDDELDFSDDTEPV